MFLPLFLISIRVRAKGFFTKEFSHPDVFQTMTAPHALILSNLKKFTLTP